MSKTLKHITLTHPSGEVLSGNFFPGFGDSNISNISTPLIPGNSEYAARYNHGHYTSEIQPQDDDETNLYISKALLAKIENETYTKSETEKLISDMITGISWAGTVNTFEDLPKSPYSGLKDGTVYAVLTKTTVGDEEKPSGTYRLHIESEHPIGKEDGWYLVSLDTTQLATSTNPGSISADWYTKIKTILDTGFTGIIASGGENGTSTTASRSNHTHDSRYILNSTSLSSGEQTIGTTLILPKLKHSQLGDLIYGETSPEQIVVGNISQKLVLRRNNTNISSTKNGVTGYLWDTHNLSEDVVNFCKNLQQNPSSNFPGYGGSGDDWGTSTTVARSDHKHSTYAQGEYDSSYFLLKNKDNGDCSLVIQSGSPQTLSLVSTSDIVNPAILFSQINNENYGSIYYEISQNRFSFNKPLYGEFIGNLTGTASNATNSINANNAKTLNGKSLISSYSTPEGDKIPFYSAQGNLYAYTFSCKIAQDTTSDCTSVFVENGSDGFIRRTSPSNFRSKVTDEYYFKTGRTGQVDYANIDTWESRKSGFYSIRRSGYSEGLLVFSNQIDTSTSGCEIYFDYLQRFLKFRTLINNERYNPWTDIWTSKSLTKLSQLTNDSGFITNTALSGYLPLKGGSMEGDLNMNSKIISSVAEITFSSDRRLKTNLVKWNDAQGRKNDISKIDATFFKFKENNDLQCGYIAQEVIEIFPEYVHKREDGFYTVDYNSIFTAKIALLEEENKNLKSELEKLNSKIENLLKTILNK